MTDLLKRRTRSQLKLALLNDCACLKTLAELEHDARLSGLTGAEIDAALGGRSFEAMTSVAISFACAAKGGEPEQVAAARARAMRLGMSGQELDEIARETSRILVEAGR
ncbi:MAG: hypothetical protein CFE37_13230 [Alphaproteobacteria bacterium PA4]|nr:MAG: hypothetical protein CFE37_13230 [Alphaproteobacteria bacterium PA4]